MFCIDPRAFALHKLWVSRQNSREAIKRRRDAEQARAVAMLAADHLNLDFKAKDLLALQLALRQAAKQTRPARIRPISGGTVRHDMLSRQVLHWRYTCNFCSADPVEELRSSAM